MSVFDYKKEWGIPGPSRKHELGEEFEIPEAMKEAALRKVGYPLKEGVIYTTLVRATQIDDVDSVFEHGFVRPKKKGVMSGENQLVFINRLTEHNTGFLNDPVICSRTYENSLGGFSVSFILDEEKLRADGFLITEAPKDSLEKPVLVAGGHIKGPQDIKPSYFSGIVVGVGSKDLSSAKEAVFSEAYKKVEEFEKKEGRKATGDERANMLHKAQTEFAIQCQADKESIKRLVKKVLGLMIAAYHETSELALPIYDLQGNLLWPQD